MSDKKKTYLLKELTRTIDESDSTAGFCLCQRWILKDALALLKEQKGLMLALEQSNAVNGYLNAEVERLNGLLKKQEAVKPQTDAFGHPYCPKCKILVYETWEFCPHCGQEMKRNEQI